MAATPMKEVLLVGFGAVGAVYSLVLKRSGLARVTAVARSNYELVNSHGIHFRSQKFGDIPGWKPDRLCSSVSSAADQAYDYVVVTTKAIPDVTRTSSLLSALLSAPYTEKYSQPTYVLLQNGLNVEADLYQALEDLGKGDPKIISTAVYIGTNLLAPDVVEHNLTDRVQLGWYRHGDYTPSPIPQEADTLVKNFGDILRTGGSTVTVVPEIQRVKFAKNFWNVAFSSFATLTRYTLPAIFRQPPADPSINTYAPYVSPRTAELIEQYTIPAIEGILKELISLGRAMGYPDSEDGLPASHVTETLTRTRALHDNPDSTHKPSMLLDAEKEQPIEVEVIFGEVVRMARERNVDIPRIETLYALLLVVQNQILRKSET